MSYHQRPHELRLAITLKLAAALKRRAAIP
jgi:hypothetical protein